MKKKVLFSAMVLAAAFSGCSNEDLMESVSSNGLERRAAGKVEFTIPDASGTRMEQKEDGSIVFSADDRISAALMDEFKGAYPVTDFVNYMQTNYPFSKEGDSKWVSTGVLLEGNYFFSYPFDACVQNRGALTNTVPVDQKAYDETGKVSTMQSYVDNQFYLGYHYIDAAEGCTDCNEIPTLQANVKLEKIHAYPVFRFVNQSGSPLEKPLKVYKVSLRKKDHSLFYNTVAVFPKTKEFPGKEAENEDGKYDLWKTAVFNANMPGNEVNNGNTSPFACSTVSSQTLEYNLLFPEEGYTVENWTSFEAGIIIPAGVYGEMEVVLYTNEGVGAYPVFMPANGEDYQVQTGLYKLTPERKSLTTVRLDINSLKTNQMNFTVQSTKNFEEYLAYLQPAGNSALVQVTTVGENVELSQKVYDILKNKNLKLRLKGTLIIPAGVPADAIDRINYFEAGSKLIVKGEQVIEKMPVSDKFIKDSNVIIENEGTLTLKADLPHSMIVNKGKLVAEDTDVLAMINTAEAELTVKEELTAITLLNGGEMTIEQNAEVNSLENFRNSGKIVNNGVLNTWPMRLQNMDVMLEWIPKEYQYTEKVLTCTILPQPNYHSKHGESCYEWVTRTVTVEKLVESWIESDASVTNAGIIENNGRIDCNGVVERKIYEGYIDVLGMNVEIADIVKANITSMLNIGYGKIYNNKGARLTNLSNFAYLEPAPTSYTYLVTADLSSSNLPRVEALKEYLQEGRSEAGIVNMTLNDGKPIAEQAVIRDNISKKEMDEISHKQIIYVLRNKADVDKLPNYVNAVWLENAVGKLNPKVADMSGKRMIFSGKNSLEIETSLKLGLTFIEGDTRFWGLGTTTLTDDIIMNAGSTLTADNVWTATENVRVFAKDAEVIIGGDFNNDKIEIDYNELSDFVGPWVVK